MVSHVHDKLNANEDLVFILLIFIYMLSFHFKNEILVNCLFTKEGGG